MKGACIGKVT